MVLEYKRKKFSADTSYTIVVDKKFKTNLWKIKFAADLSKIDSPAVALAASIISSCNCEENTMALLNSKLSNLYGADLFSSVSKRGDVFIMTVGISIIDDSYALENEKLSKEAVSLLIKSIFSPNIEDNGFDSDIFNIEKNDLIDSILANINDKRKYLYLKSYEEIFKGESSALSIYGSLENAKLITPEQAYKAYIEFINNSVKEIFFEGINEYPETEDMLKNVFSDLSEIKYDLKFESDVILKEKRSDIIEKLNVSQSKFLLAFKNKSYDKYTMRMLSAILGGLPSSKLFTNVREKQSLCYYCTSSYVTAKNTLIIDCGVDTSKEKAAIDAVLFQLDEIRKGNITQEEIDAALLSFDNSLKSVGDVHGSYSAWYFENFCSGEFVLPDVSSSRYHSVTAEMIQKAANALTEDTLYIIESNEKEEDR